MKRFQNQARLAALRGDHDDAIRIYRQAISTYSEIAWMYRANLNRELSELGVRVPSVVFGMATIPERAISFSQAMLSICFQADKLNVYLDQPGAAYQGPSPRGIDLQITIAGKSPSLRDNGKFLRVGEHENCYFFTVDDDIIYPPDYVEVMIEAIERYGRRAVVGVHGITLPKNAERYFCQERTVLHFERGLEKDMPVNILGTGALAFHSSTVTGLSLEHFPYTGMTDISFATFCRSRRIPLVAVAHRHKWLRGLRTENISLYEEFHDTDTLQSEIVRCHRPWGKQAIQQAVESVLQQPDNSSRMNTAFAALMTRFPDVPR